MNAIEHFKKNNLFDQMDEAEQKRILEKCQKITVLSGEYVFRENESGDALYIVEEGTVSLKKLIAILLISFNSSAGSFFFIFLILCE